MLPGFHIQCDLTQWNVDNHQQETVNRNHDNSYPICCLIKPGIAQGVFWAIQVPEILLLLWTGPPSYHVQVVGIVMICHMDFLLSCLESKEVLHTPPFLEQPEILQTRTQSGEDDVPGLDCLVSPYNALLLGGKPPGCTAVWGKRRSGNVERSIVCIMCKGETADLQPLATPFWMLRSNYPHLLHQNFICKVVWGCLIITWQVFTFSLFHILLSCYGKKRVTFSMWCGAIPRDRLRK